jgi:pyridoxal phosphate enzyme (YggS family)
MTTKYQQLPKDIQWHMIGHMQSNKVKYIASFVTLIHSVDSLTLLQIINKEAEKNQRIIDCLLQVYIASEETKFGLDETELDEICEAVKNNKFPFIRIRGLMGMASFSDDEILVRSEFKNLKNIFVKKKAAYFSTGEFDILSMGMSGDYKIAIEEGATMVRIGSNIFGERNYKTNSSPNIL